MNYGNSNIFNVIGRLKMKVVNKTFQGISNII